MKIGFKKSKIVKLFIVFLILGVLGALFFVFKDKIFVKEVDVVEEEKSYFPEDHAPFFPFEDNYALSSCTSDNSCYNYNVFQPYIKEFVSHNGQNIIIVEYLDMSGNYATSSLIVSGNNSSFENVIYYEDFDPEMIELNNNNYVVGKVIDSAIMDFTNLQKRVKIGDQILVKYIRSYPDNKLIYCEYNKDFTCSKIQISSLFDQQVQNQSNNFIFEMSYELIN